MYHSIKLLQSSRNIKKVCSPAQLLKIMIIVSLLVTLAAVFRFGRVTLPPPRSPPSLPHKRLVVVNKRNASSCDGEHAPGALEALRLGATQYCNSLVRCVHRRLDFAESFCEVESLVVDLRRFAQYLDQPLAQRGDEPDARDAYYVFGDLPQGTFSVQEACALNASLDLFHKGSSHDLRAGWGIGPVLGPNEDCAFVEEPTVFLSKLYGKDNMWHASEDLLHTFENSELFGWRTGQGARLLVLDVPRGVTAEDQAQPYYQVYKAVFGPRYGYSAAWQFFESLGNKSCVEFKKTYWQPHGGSSAFQRSVATPSNCTNSPLILGMVDTILSTVLSAPMPVDVGRVTVVVRNVSTVRSVVSPAWSSFENAVRSKPRVEFVDFAAMGIVEQIKLAYTSHTLIGLHGAALTHGLWMQPSSRLVEVDLGFRCYCYRNVASWVGIEYRLLAEDQLAALNLSSHALGFP